MWEYRAKIIDVTDGDTVKVLVDLGFFARYEASIRLLDVWAPEMGMPGGLETKQFVIDWAVGHSPLRRWPVSIVTQTTKVLEPTEKMTFTRYIGDIYDLNSGDHLNARIREFVAQHPEWTA